MPLGFDPTEQSAESAAKNFIRVRKKKYGQQCFSPAHKKSLKDSYLHQQINYESFGDLFNKNNSASLGGESSDISIWDRNEPNILLVYRPSEMKFFRIKGYTSTNFMKSNQVWVGQYGKFSLSVKKVSKEYDFTFSVWADSWLFHPEVIKQIIVNRYDLEVYKEWKKQLLEDITSAQKLVTYCRRRFNKIISSVTCSDSSARFCKKAGLYVKNDIAFLFPEKFNY